MSRQLFYLAVLFCLTLCAPVGAHSGIDEQIAAVTLQLKTEPRNAQLYLMRGELHRLHRDWTAARADFNQVAKLDATLREVEFSRGRLWLDAAQPRLAAVAFTRFLAAHRTHAEAYILRARAYAQLKQYRAAAHDYSRAIALLPRAKPDHYLERAAALAHANQRAAALRSLDKAITQLGSLVTLQLKAIEIETQLKRWDAALVRVDLLASQTPRKESWLFRRAEILRQAHRTYEARAAYDEAAEALAALPPAQRHTKAMDELAAQIQSALAH